jgi:hypothetical protein
MEEIKEIIISPIKQSTPQKTDFQSKRCSAADYPSPFYSPFAALNQRIDPPPLNRCHSVNGSPFNRSPSTSNSSDVVFTEIVPAFMETMSSDDGCTPSKVQFGTPISDNSDSDGVVCLSCFCLFNKSS